MDDEPQPVGRFDWERLILRADLPKHLKALALVVGVHASNDGSRVRPGRRLLADILDDSERTVEMGLQALVDRGLLLLVQRGGGRGGEGRANVYQLSDPGPEWLLLRLDPDGNRLVKKVAKTRAGRPNEAKRVSGQSPVDNSADLGSGHRIDPKPVSVENDFHPKPVTDSPETGFALSLLNTKRPLPPACFR